MLTSNISIFSGMLKVAMSKKLNTTVLREVHFATSELESYHL